MEKNTSPIGDRPFDKTMMMLEIEKRDIELSQMKVISNLQTEAIREMALVMQNHSDMFQRGMNMTEEDWREFCSSLTKYDVDMNEPILASIAPALRNAVQEFLRYKLGSACAEKING